MDYTAIFVISLYSYATLLYVTLIILLALQSLVELQLLSTFPSTFWFPNLEASQQNVFFYGVGLSVPCLTPNLEDQVIIFCWVTTFDLSGMGDPNSSYATDSIAVMIIQPCKPHHGAKVWIP